MAKRKAPMSVEKKQLRWIKRHNVGIGSFVRIARVPSEDELKGFPDFDMDMIRQFRGALWGHVFLIEERSITICFDNGCDEYVDVPYYILDVGGMDGNRTSEYIFELNDRIPDFLGKKVLVTREAYQWENGWGGHWFPVMDDFVGGYFRVTGVSASGMRLSNGDEYAFFPYFVLEKADNPAPTRTAKKTLYRDREREWFEKNSITVGSKVTIVRRAKDYEDGGDNNWNPEMDSYVGHIGEVVDLGYLDRGLYVQFHDGKRMYSFPYFVLEKIPDAQPFTCSDTVKQAAEKLVERYDSVIHEMISSGKQPPKRTEPVTETLKEWIEKHQVREGTEARVIWAEETAKRSYNVFSEHRRFITRMKPAIFVECPDLRVGGFVPYWDLEVMESKFPTFEEWSGGEKDLRGKMFRTASGCYGVILSSSPIRDDLVVRISGNGERYVLPYYALELI